MLLVWVVSVLALAHGMDKTRLWQPPPPMKGFNLQPSLGRWYIQFRSAPCSWSGSAEFRDYETNMMMESKKSILMRETMRNGMCNTVTARMFVQSPPGVFILKDPMGNNWSGSYIIPAIDYKTFSITYGCTKMSTMGDKCDDPWISIKTRMPNPGPKVIAMINGALMRLWGVTVDQLQQVHHQQSCLTASKPLLSYGGPFISKQ